VSATTGNFSIVCNNPAWTLGGTIGKTIDHISPSDGQDAIGPYREIQFRWTAEGRRSGSIRLYRSRPLVLFSETFDDAVNGSPGPFPVLSQLPPKLLAFRYGEDAHMGGMAFHLTGLHADQPYGGPFLLFDDQADAMILSPASDFMIARLDGDQQHGLSSGFNAALKSVPAGYHHQTILAIGAGINHTWDAWGHGLTDLYGKARPASDADTGLKYLGYWTDNGSYYYYNYDLDKGYAATLLAATRHLQSLGVAIHYLQLDSWWYPKTFNSVQANSSNKPKNPKLPAGTWNRYGGLLEYTPHPFLFPDGLTSFQKSADVGLITHNRWIDPTSPYHAQYKISGIAAVDQNWWDKIISSIAGWGVQTYEQDWNNFIYRDSPDLSSTTWAGDAFMDGMAKACATNGVTMQYCMILPRNLMQGGAKYSDLTTVRVSDDRFEPSKWRPFLYGSRFASAMGVWPWTDVFHSSETPNILLATLSAGMVGLSDQTGKEDLLNISRVARADGVIVKPDEPIVPLDSSFVAAAQGRDVPIISATSGGDAKYVFAFSQDKVTKKKGTKELLDWSIKPASLGMSGTICDYDYFAATASIVSADQPIAAKLNDQGWSYHILVPVDSAGMAFIGDIGKFVTRGKKRIAAVQENSSSLQATVLAAPMEKTITLAIYAPSKPAVSVENGSCDQISYDAKTGIAIAKISVNSAAPMVEVDGDPVIRLVVEFKLA